ncbi:MAG: 50S ribosomal protein L6, partial [Candidatus Heimdallarchaeota archaeon]|nr:50S ribosomal protein L6 [Candidatus Heimdallarchaeota archaeon]
MKLVYLTKTIEIPEEIDITIDNKKVSVKGQKGVLTSDYTDHDIDLEKRENTLIIKGFFLNKKKKAKTLA